MILPHTGSYSPQTRSLWEAAYSRILDISRQNRGGFIGRFVSTFTLTEVRGWTLVALTVALSACQVGHDF